MIIRIIILAIATCFFLENIVVHIVIGKNTTYYLTEAGENDASENEDEAKKEKKKTLAFAPVINTFSSVIFLTTAFTSLMNNPISNTAQK